MVWVAGTGLLVVLVVIGGGWRYSWRLKVEVVVFFFSGDRWRLVLTVLLLPIVNGDEAKVATVAVVGDGVLLLSTTCSSVVGVSEDGDGRRCPSHLVMDAGGIRRQK
ncbi:hypothetical protein Dimus_027388 [Dionaea muscipula]